MKPLLNGSRRFTSAVADATGVPEEEIVVLAAVAAVATAAVFLFRNVEALLDAWPH